MYYDCSKFEPLDRCFESEKKILFVIDRARLACFKDRGLEPSCSLVFFIIQETFFFAFYELNKTKHYLEVYFGSSLIWNKRQYINKHSVNTKTKSENSFVQFLSSNTNNLMQKCTILYLLEFILQL